MSADAATVGFFEGTEKLLEIWFSGHEAKDKGLRLVRLLHARRTFIWVRVAASG